MKTRTRPAPPELKMILKNNIGWCDDTTNAVTGCDKVSPGCKNCYAEAGTRARVLRHQGIETWGPKGVRHPVAEFAKKVRRLNKLCICDECHTGQPVGRLFDPLEVCLVCRARSTLRRIRLFADSNSDWLDEKWPVETLAAFLKEIHDAPNIDLQLLTKRPENFVPKLTEIACKRNITDTGMEHSEISQWVRVWLHGEQIPPNVWLGVSVENQAMADLRIPQLLQIPAAVRFLSCEPLLEQIQLPIKSGASTENVKFPDGFQDWTEKRREAWFQSTARATYIARCHTPFDWCIVGAESGQKRREVPVEAILSIADQCKAAGVPCYVKQDGHLTSGFQGRIPDTYWQMKQFSKAVTL